MTTFQKIALVTLRLSAGWYFFYAGIIKVLNPEWSAAGYLLNAKTFPDFFVRMAQPDLLPFVNFVNEWALTLLGLSLLLGIAVRFSSILGIFLMLLYYFPVLEFPHIPPHAYIVDSHIMDALVLLVLAAFQAGRVFGLERAFSRLPVISRIPRYRTWVG